MCDDREQPTTTKKISEINRVISLTANLINCLWNMASEYIALKQRIQIIRFARLKCKCEACLVGSASGTTEIENDSTDLISINNSVCLAVMESRK